MGWNNTITKKKIIEKLRKKTRKYKNLHGKLQNQIKATTYQKEIHAKNC